MEGRRGLIRARQKWLAFPIEPWRAKTHLRFSSFVPLLYENLKVLIDRSLRSLGFEQLLTETIAELSEEVEAFKVAKQEEEARTASLQGRLDSERDCWITMVHERDLIIADLKTRMIAQSTLASASNGGAPPACGCRRIKRARSDVGKE